MIYTKKEVMQYVCEEDVKFIRLAFCDPFGVQKNISIMPDELERAFEHGIGIDSTAIEGFGGVDCSDIFLFPDPSTLSVLPWRPSHGRVVRMFCSLFYADGKPFELDSRKILKDAAKVAMESGCTFNISSEIEFYLFKTDEEGNPTDVPFDNAGYMDIAPADKGENVRREICLTLEQMGIKPESSHHEEGPGQNEIDFKFSDPVTAADNAITFLSVVKTVAARNGLCVSFLPKPLENRPGNGFHINISLKNIKDEKDDTSYSFAIAGIMNRIKAMTVFLNPLESSYARLGLEKAPNHITWSKENRRSLIRIPADKGGIKRFQLRSPDPSANPYIAYALMIYAAMEGIKNKEELAAEAKDCENENYAKLPQTLMSAMAKAKESEFIKSFLPGAMIKKYCK